ncbi:nicotinate-nucleotide adenylyltransferase [Cohnella endophytica]|uniref:Probable nicotinate-nucleotide adenylyltransferase n=1 Tax=Cohnella endophytica TaxID=2419778 RepID=A0A494XZI3_9BACL|nr:nicotinate-nucleotide adenylyltransferase [Cohnella endophytica]RKP55168.1 nicotinate-nucleotide adenylyltransferase [Cohnella endophytica]
MRKIGLLGGTFDPIHHGHLIAAEAAREAVGLDEVWLIPTAAPPHKPQPSANADQRRLMLDTAIAGNPAMRVEDIELRRAGSSYTIDTVTSLQEREPEIMFYWIVGSDMVKDLPNWRRIEELAERVTFIGLERPDQPSDDSRLPSFIRRKLLRAAMPPMGISSSDIRRRLKSGRSIRYMLPDSVIEIIQRDGLYES